MIHSNDPTSNVPRPPPWSSPENTSSGLQVGTDAPRPPLFQDDSLDRTSDSISADTFIRIGSLPVAEAAVEGHDRRTRRSGTIPRVLGRLLQQQPSWLVSLFVHLLILLILGLIYNPIREGTRAFLTLDMENGENGQDELDLTDMSDSLEIGLPDAPADLAIRDMSQIEIDIETELPPPLSFAAEAKPAAPVSNDGARRMSFAPDQPGGGLASRRARRKGAIGRGATPDSEAAVDRALEWLAQHQESDGSWHFELDICGPRCRNTGSISAVNASTALALLPFLGAGYTHQGGDYQQQVSDGLTFLMNNQRSDGSFFEELGTMYSHGLATLAICEALAMTPESPGEHRNRSPHGRPGIARTELAHAAQGGIDFIVENQHSGGGWRYQPRQRGDTSIVGWQAMALQSARMSNLRIPNRTFVGISRFLDSVSSGEYQSRYGYTTRQDRPSTSSIGLLSRMYLGWDRGHPGIVSGVEHLRDVGPSSNNAYYNYYATQVMHHYGGETWQEWNELLRDHLVETQVTRGHQRGSWYFDGDRGSGPGGRLYITALCTMVLEVYYRHMPIYSMEAVAARDRLKDSRGKP